MFINTINPVLIHLGSFQVRYYGLFIVLAIILGYFFVKHMVKKRHIEFTTDEVLDLTLWVVAGILIGSRLFYIVIYNLPYYLANPLAMIAVWEGGLSFHGGLFGAALGGYLYCRFKKKNFWQMADLVVIPIAFGLFLGRIANFMNSELIGRVTNVPWAVNFNNEKDALGNLIYRHPSQLYEAAKNLFIFGTLWIMKDKNLRNGTIFCTFIVMYSSLRFFIEFFRQPDPQVGFLMLGLTMGQILNIIMFFVGAGLLAYVYRKKAK